MLIRYVTYSYDILRRGLDRGAIAVAAQLPVMGPHDDSVAVELLLNGKKPIGWFIQPRPLPLSMRVSGPNRMDRELVASLDSAVLNGKLNFKDVLAFNPPIGGREVPPWVVRHYGQPQKSTDLALIAAYNNDGFNRREPAVKLKKSDGDYLGYRKRDQFYWNARHFLHRDIQKWLIKNINVKIAQPAYREWVTRDNNVDRYFARLSRKNAQTQTRELAKLGPRADIVKLGSAGRRAQRRALTLIERLRPEQQVEIMSAPDVVYRLGSGDQIIRLVGIIDRLPTSLIAAIMAAPHVGEELLTFANSPQSKRNFVVDIFKRLSPEQRAPILASIDFRQSLAGICRMLEMGPDEVGKLLPTNRPASATGRRTPVFYHPT